MLRECGVQRNRATKKRRETDRHFLDSYMVEFMWRSKLNNSESFETILIYF